MIELFTEKIECCGCGACMNVCSKEAISMKKDEYGFVYPRINMEKCIGCGACKKVCAFQSNTIKNKPQKVYAIASKNNNIVKRLITKLITAATIVVVPIILVSLYAVKIPP